MTIETLKNLLPEYAKDIKLNLSTLANEELLTKQQLWGTFLASALAGRNESVIQNVMAEASAHLSQEAIQAAKAANAIMAMNNIYYRTAGHMDDYKTLPAKLRMNIIANPGVDKNDFELWSVAVSAINGCQFCVHAHEKTLITHGFTKEQVQAALRIAAVVHAAAVILDGEHALNDNYKQAAA